jgi:phosphomethylpyrimidine synthase
MSTQLESARKNRITPQMEQVAEDESVSPESVRRLVEECSVVIPYNKKRNFRAVGIGKSMSTKTNANLGTSDDEQSLDGEIEKLKAAIEAGATTVMDLSTGGDIHGIRQRLLKETTIPLGTVPIYQAICENLRDENPLDSLTGDKIFETIEQHGRDGVDYITVHCGVTRESVSRIEKEGRILDIVSRGGAITAKWIKYTGEENPLYEQFDRLIEISREYDMTLSLGDGLRPGCLSDSTDRGQVQETIILGELAARAQKAGVQVMIEGPGHMAMDEIEANIILMKRLCNDAPFYVLGPLVTDVAPGYDHITAAIGGAIAARAGADFLCVVTPSEHLRLPDADDIREGVMAARIAAHAADIGKLKNGAVEWDNKMARARKNLDWETQINTAIDPKKASFLRQSSKPQDDSVCTMCSALCAIKYGDLTETHK